MPDQNTFQSKQWGTLTFFPAATTKWKDCCRHCLLFVRKAERQPTDECCSAPCNSEERADGRNGYFSIQQMPQK